MKTHALVGEPIFTYTSTLSGPEMLNSAYHNKYFADT